MGDKPTFDVRSVCLVVNQRQYRFELCRKPLRLEELFLSRYWIDHRTLYDRKNRAVFDQVIDCYWQLCLAAQAKGETLHRDDSQRYLLASLLPSTMPQLARQVMPDAAFDNQGQSRRFWHKGIRSLESALADPSTAAHALEASTFNRKSADLFEIPNLELGDALLYQHISDALLSEAAQVLWHNPQQAVALARGRWQALQKQYYSRRRWKSAPAKRVFSVISHEAKAAFFECYSDVWNELLAPAGPMVRELGFTVEEQVFHSLWHLLLKADCMETADAAFFLFHGHIVGLHPTGAMLIQTAAGQQILSKLISAAAASGLLQQPNRLLDKIHYLPQFHQFNSALFLAEDAYLTTLKEYAQQRKDRRLASRDLTQNPHGVARTIAQSPGRKKDRHKKPGIADKRALFEKLAAANGWRCPQPQCDQLRYQRHEVLASPDGSQAEKLRVRYYCKQHRHHLMQEVSDEQLMQVL